MRTSAPPHFVAVDGGLRFCHDGASQRFFCGPAGAKSVLEYTARQSEALLPFNKRAGCSVKRQPHIVASVAMLLSVCRPAAVAWLVIAIVVDAVNRFSCRALAHVGKEVLKFQPPPAHFDAACTVATETSRLWILTPLQHAGPYPVCCSRLVTNVMSVFRRSLFIWFPESFAHPQETRWPLLRWPVVANVSILQSQRHRHKTFPATRFVVDVATVSRPNRCPVRFSADGMMWSIIY